jgi:plastocyanin
MNWHKAHYDGFIPPMFFNNFVGLHEGIVESADTIRLEGEHRLKFNPNEVKYAVGTEVVVTLNRWFWFMSKEDHEALLHKKEAERAQQEEEYRQRTIAKRLEAEEFNSEFNFPFEWEVGIKAVLSGLTERSMGNGVYSKTVYHVLLKSPLKIGRMKRSAGEFLCTPHGGSNGVFSDLVTPEYFQDADGVQYKPKITCKSCLKIAERWRAHSI